MSTSYCTSTQLTSPTPVQRTKTPPFLRQNTKFHTEQQHESFVAVIIDCEKTGKKEERTLCRMSTCSDSNVQESREEWNVVLLVDSNERVNPHSKIMPREELVYLINDAFGGATTSGKVHCETRHLHAGDYLWIARKQGWGERVLDCIIERKTLHDLVGSVTNPSRSCAPLKRMHVQMKKLESTTLSNKIFLLENHSPGTVAKFVPQGTLASAWKFAAQVRKGEYAGFTFKETKSVIGTARFLQDQHAILIKQVEEAHSQALASQEMGLSVDEKMMKLPPFARIGTLQNMNDCIKRSLNDPSFLYYLELRRVPNLGETKTQSILARFPTKEELQQCANSRTCLKTLAGLHKLGLTMAKHIRDHFATLPLPPETPKIVRKRKRNAAVVTPETKSVESRAVARNTRRRLFDDERPRKEAGEAGKETVQDDDSTCSSTHGNHERDFTAEKLPRTRRCLFPKPSVNTSGDLFDSSSDDDSLFEPIFSKPRPKSPPGSSKSSKCGPVARDAGCYETERRRFPVGLETKYLPKDAEIIEID